MTAGDIGQGAVNANRPTLVSQIHCVEDISQRVFQSVEDSKRVMTDGIIRDLDKINVLNITLGGLPCVEAVEKCGNMAVSERPVCAEMLSYWVVSPLRFLLALRI